MVKTKKKVLWIVLPIVAALLLTAGIGIWYFTAHFGYAREVSSAEQALREKLISQAESWLGAKESDGSHKAIIDLYNSHTPLAQGYKVKDTDNWCATFVSAAAIEAGLTDIIPTECGCQRQIGLFDKLGLWVEDDGYIPLPGDLIYYSSQGGLGDNQGWSDHVGIVVGTNRFFIKTIEGNYGDRVTYRIIPINASSIRGFATPNYGVTP